MKGIILAGGSGTRLHPLTQVTSKQLLPIYDKPMIFYPLSVLMEAGIREILVISTPVELPRFRHLLGGGERYGVTLSYLAQPKPEGLAQAFVLGEEFLGGGPAAMILGDNLFAGHGLGDRLKRAAERVREEGGATIFGYYAEDPRRFGVVELEGGRAVSLEEKPSAPKSHYCVTGLYFYDGRAAEFAKTLRRSARNEYEITDLNKLYLARGELRVEILGRGYAWMDAGTPESLLDAALYVRAVETHQRRKLGCPEEVAYRNGWIGRAELAARYAQGRYGQYLKDIAEGTADGVFGPGQSEL